MNLEMDEKNERIFQAAKELFALHVIQLQLLLLKLLKIKKAN